jgi:hypothetical protein
MPSDALHRHRWAVIDFFVDQDRPMMRQSCACGGRRAIPAWDRSWDPDATIDADPARGPSGIREEL